ncbi:hypothetical protein [Fulvivirga lutea]|uniref:Uncharacterized protein n=1 Tax=Fulvivirga lutea TaxID=2810512 RepID=A0A974WJ35_9BACT|nr:hypothetical protein [Fulvivirga lutea]QSE97085.1 hypothetical protein JR347_16045 [Fulvivirga lutea]
MKKLLVPAFLLITTFSNGQDQKVQDLDFLIGTWEITFDIYDTHHPEKGIIFSEIGRQECYYDLEHNGEPRFITCKGKVAREDGRERTFQESIRYGNFSGTFERVGIFSNWPATSEELLFYHEAERRFEIRGELGVQDNMLERYEDIYQFNEDYTSYERKNVANFSNMPVTEYNVTLMGTGKKIK